MYKLSKKNFLIDYYEDFSKARGAINEIVHHNRNIDFLLIQDLEDGDFKKLEEHIEITKLIMDGVKSLNELYNNVPKIIENLNKLPDLSEIDDDKKNKKNIADLLNSFDKFDNSDGTEKTD